MLRSSIRGAAALFLAAAVAVAAFAGDPPIASFAAAQPLSAAQVPAYLVSADFDGDLDLDWAVYDIVTSNVKIRRNDGTGLVYSSNGFGVGFGVTDMAVGDFTHDGKPDLALATFGGIIIATNLGVDVNGTLQFSLSTPLPDDPAASYRNIATGDYDGDLSDDVVATGSFTSSAVPPLPGAGILSVFISDGAGGFKPAVDRVYALDVPTAVAVGDLTGDGRAEIVVAAINMGRMHVYFNPNSGSVDVSQGNDDTIGTNLEITSIAVADVTRDGRKDIVTVGLDQGSNIGQNVRTEIYPTRATTSFGNIFNMSFGFELSRGIVNLNSAATDRCAVADVNGDGFAEIVATYGRGEHVAVFVLAEPARLPNGDVDVLTEFATSTYGAGTAPQRVVAGDFDGDGKTDLLTLGTGTSASLLLNTGTGAEDDANPPAKKLAVKSKAFPPGDRFQDGQKFTFTCEQSAPGVHVLLQHTTTPADGASWEDLPVNEFFTKGKGASVKWTLTGTHVPAGHQFFRTVTTGGGLEDGVNTAAPTTSADDRYIGPFEILSKGPVIVFNTSAYPASDYETRTTTHTGDSVAYVTSVANYGTETAMGLRIQMRLPVGTTLNEPLTSLGWAWLDKKHTKIEWNLPVLPAKGKAVYVMTVDVVATKGSVKLFDVSAGADKGRSIRDGSSTIALKVTSPVRIKVVARQSSPTPGGLLEYDLTATNLGATTLSSAVAWDRLPRGVAFELGYFVNAAGDPIVSPVAAPGGRANAFHDRAARKVFWYLGDMAPGQVQHLRLVTRLQFDHVIGNVLVNGAYELRGASPGRTGVDPLRVETLDVASPGPHDVRTTVSGPYPLHLPVFRLNASASTAGGAKVHDKRFGDVALVAPGAEVRFFYVIGNSGGATAKAVHFQGNLPNNTTLVPGSVMIGPFSGGNSPATHTISSGGSLDVDVGDVDGTTLLLSFRALVAANAKDRSMLVSRDFHLVTDSLGGNIFASPSPLNVCVAQPYVPAIETHPEIPAAGFVHEGDTIAFFTTWANVGGTAGSGDLSQTVPAGCSYLDATFFDSADTQVAKFDADGNAVGVPTVSYALKPTKAKLVVSLGTLLPGARGKARFRFTVAKAPKSRVLTSQAGLGGKVAGGLTKAGTKVAPSVPPTTSTANLRVETDESPQLFVVRVAPLVVRTGLEFVYTCIVGNASDHEATNVVMSMDAPSGTKLIAQSVEEFGADGRVKGRNATWTIGALAPHSVAVRAIRVIVDDDAGKTGNAVIEGSLYARSDNAVGWKPSPQASLLIVTGKRFEPYAWPSVSVSLSTLGMLLGTDQPASIDDAVRAMSEDSASIMSCGADITQFTNGAFLAPLGAGLAFAFGNKSDVSTTSGTATTTYGGTCVIVAPASAITITGIPGHEQTTGLAALTAPMLLVDAGVANLIVGGSYAQVARDGRTLLGPDSLPIGLVQLDVAGLVAAGGGNLVAAGGGNIVPTGAGSLVGNDGASLIGNDGGTLVAAGGGNLVAAGGGNLVAAGGGNLVAAGAGNLVAAGGGNIVAAGGLNLVAAGGGN